MGKKLFDDPVDVKRSSAVEQEIDARIRAAGYTIHARPEEGESSWTKGNVVFTQSDVLRRLADGVLR